ncbi:MAG: hypothetical protein RSG77_25600 [Hafnia sp.]
MQKEQDTTLLAKQHAKIWLSTFGTPGIDDKEIKEAIAGKKDDPIYLNAIESELLRLDTRHDIISSFNTDIDLFVIMKKQAAHTGIPAEGLRLTRIKPNTNNLIINV